MKFTIPEIANQMTAMINNAGIYTTRGLDFCPSKIEERLTNAYEYGRTFSDIRLEFRQAWGVEVTLYINTEIKEMIRREHPYKALFLNIEFNFPSCVSDMSAMNARIALMRKVTDLASLIHTSFNGVEIEEDSPTP